MTEKMFYYYDRIIFLDVETTGFNPEEDQITELSYILYERSTDRQWQNAVIYDTYINLFKKDMISEKVKEITGITEKLLEEKGVSESEVCSHIFELMLSDCKTLIIAHNANFDLSFIYDMLNRHILLAESCLKRWDVLDTLTVARDRFSKPHSLEATAEHYNVSFNKDILHSAVYDCSLLAEIMEPMWYEKSVLYPDDYVNLIGIDPKHGVSGRKFDYLKYFIQDNAVISSKIAKINSDRYKELTIFLIDVFEDFLNEKNVVIRNDEHEDNEGEAIIYGSDYDYLREKITDILLAVSLKNYK